MADSSERMRRAGKRLRLWAGLVLLVTVISYLPALDNAFVWDDLPNIAQNRSLRSVEGLKQIWTNPRASLQYYPLTYTVFWVEYHLWGPHPFGYHLVNVLLHALNAVLLGVLLESLAVPGAWLAALIFAVHPVHVESVAWATELKNVLSGFFFLASVLAWLRYRSGGERGRRFYGLAWALFLCALLSKTSTVSLPLVLLALIWWKDGEVRGRDAGALLPFFLATPLALVTAWVEKHDVGAVGAEWQLTLLQRCLVAGRVVWFYAGKLVWPQPLMFVYPRWSVEPSVWWQWLFPLGTAAVLVLAWRGRGRWGKGPLVATAFFVGMTAPVPAFYSLYYMHYSYVADHFQYLASMGLIALAAAGLTVALRHRAGLMAVAVPVLIVLGALSWRHCHAFHDPETLWRDTLAKNPGCWMAHGNLGLLLAGEGKLAEAVGECDQAVWLNPADTQAHNNLGFVLAKQGETEEAIGEFQRALSLDPLNAGAYFNWGDALLRSGSARDAVLEYQKAVQLRPDDVEMLMQLGIALARCGRLDEAIDEYHHALEIDPGNAAAHYNLGVALMRNADLEQAIAQFQEAVGLDPGYVEAHGNLGAALARAGRLTEAIQEYEQALRLRPDSPALHNNLGLALQNEGKLEEAIAQFQEALRLDPDFKEASRNLENAQAAQEEKTP